MMIAQSRKDDRKLMSKGTTSKEIAATLPKRKAKSNPAISESNPVVAASDVIDSTAIIIDHKSNKNSPTILQAELETEEKHFTVRKIVRSALNEYNDEMFLVWWEGYPEPDENDPTFGT